MEKIASMFAEQFAHWDITLPPKSLAARSAGHIKKAGWLIQFCFGRDKKGEYLDFYCAHRMTDDDHIRLYEDGTLVELPALSNWRITSDDPVEDKRLQDEFDATNQKTTEALVAKGFDLFTINMSLNAGLVKPDKK